MTARQDIVDALATVEGLSAFHAQPPVVAAGSAWPVLSRTEWVNGCFVQGTWFVFVALPAGSELVTVAAGDELLEPVGAALHKVGHVIDCTPYQIPVEPGQQAVPVLRYTLEL